MCYTLFSSHTVSMKNIVHLWKLHLWKIRFFKNVLIEIYGIIGKPNNSETVTFLFRPSTIAVIFAWGLLISVSMPNNTLSFIFYNTLCPIDSIWFYSRLFSKDVLKRILKPQRQWQKMLKWERSLFSVCVWGKCVSLSGLRRNATVKELLWKKSFRCVCVCLCN